MRAASRASTLAMAAALVALAVTASTAAAHPLGNFSVNRLSQVRISADRVEVRYVLDQAEIPTFQDAQRFDRDGSGTVDGAERAGLLEAKLAEIRAGLALEADGRALSLAPVGQPRLSFPPGQGGLSLTRIELDLAASLPPGARAVAFEDETFSDQVGWQAVEAVAGEGTDVRSSVPATDPTDGLRAYPQDLLSSPPHETAASFAVRPGSGAVDAPAGPDGGETTADRAQDGFAGALAGGDTGGLAILLLLAAALGWGALHALSPGHGKSMVAAYLVGSRGTPKHAAILGLTVTVTHTAAVFALGLVTLFASEYVLPEDLYPWLGVASGATVVVIGLSVMRSRFRRWRALRAESHHHHHHGGGGHDHGHSHSHAPPDGPLGLRGLVALGVSGGIVPCPSALVVLVAAISQHRVGLGMALITAFSLGLAATLTAVGLAVLYGGRLVARLRPERRLFGGRIAGALPAASASLIVLAGTLITVRAIPGLA